MPSFVKIGTVAEKTGLTRQTIRKLVVEGVLPAVRIDDGRERRLLLFVLEEVERALEKRRVCAVA
jgi:excisionase family DNA binding protein